MQTDPPKPTMFLLRPCLPEQLLDDDSRRSEALLATARAITSSYWWNSLGSASIVVRPQPTPLIGITGYFDEAAYARFGALQLQLERVLPTMTVLDYSDVENAAGRLAELLLERFGREAIEGFRFTAIPRGGHIVLGVLSYLLDLDQEQIVARPPAGDQGQPLVVVDDCALTGNRFRRFIASIQEQRPVIFATLFSAQELRTRIETDARVLACLSARDLRDLAPEREQHGFQSWQERWRRRHAGRSYWVGQPEPICFPWSEPDFGFWNPVTGREEKGWNLVPPERCLSHRSSARPVEVQLQAEGVGSLRAADSVLSTEFETRIVIASPQWNASVSLEGVSARMWSALLRNESVGEAASEVASEYGIEPSIVGRDLDAFVDVLLEKGALVRCRT